MAEQAQQGVADDVILAEHGKFVDRLRSARQEICRNAYDNALHYLGHQWTVYDKSQNQFRNLYLKKSTPRPVTNKIFPLINSIHSGLCRVDPMLAFRPGSDSDADRLTAEYADQVLQYLHRSTHAADVNLRLSKAVCLYSNAYKITGYDPDGGPMDWVPNWVCPQHPEQSYPADQAQQMGGVCPEDQQPLVQDPQNGQSVPRGCVVTDVGTVFDTWVDPTIPLMREHQKVMIRRMRPCEWAYQRWPELKESFRSGEAPPDTGLTYLQSLLRLTPGGGSMGYASAMRFDHAVIVDEFHSLPCEEFPQGMLAQIGNGKVVLEKIQPYPFHDGQPDHPGRAFLPIAHYYADDVVPTHIATGPIDHLKEPQRRRNRTQARMELHEARMANGVWAIPDGADIPTPSGEIGQVLRFNAVATGGAFPKRIDGARLPATTIQTLAIIDTEMQDIAGTYEIGQGDRPKNVEGGYAMQILQNAAKGRQAPLYRRWEQSHAESARHAFYLFRLFASDTTWFAIKGEESRWRMAQIKRADLFGGVDIDVEPGTGLPQSLLEKRAGVEQAISTGLVDVANPIERLKCLRALGVPELTSGPDSTDNHIAWEHDQTIAYAKANFDEQGNPKTTPLPPFPVFIDPDFDDHPFHLDRHNAWRTSDEFKALPPDVQRAFRIGHMLQHLLKAQEQQAAQQAAQSPPQQNGKATPAKQSEGNARKNEQGKGTTGREQKTQTDRESAAA